ncbi:MAG: S1C family serine protease [Nitrospirota bacterium]
MRLLLRPDQSFLPLRWYSALLAAIVLFSAMPAPAESSGTQPSSAIEQAMHATVGILAETPAERESGFHGRMSIRGTGVHVQAGYIVTARHAVERDQGSKKALPKEIYILTADLAELPAHLVGGSAYLDIVLYRIGETHRDQLQTITPFAGTGALAGDHVFTVGYPLGWGPAVAYGRIGNPNTFLPTAETRLLQIDLSACSGNSGGGLFNAAGELVGVMHAIIQSDQGQGDHHCSQFAFAVPAILAQRIVTALTEGKQPSFSRLGVHMAQVRIGAKWRVSVGDATGPAKDGGVRKGDLLVAINDTAITDAAQLKNYLMEETTPGQTVILRVLRGDQELQLSITLAGA